MLEANENMLRQLRAALAAREENTFSALLTQCPDFSTVFTITVECAQLADQTPSILFLKKNTLKNMMETGLRRMAQLHPTDWFTLLNVGGAQLAVCVKVIESYISDENREALLQSQSPAQKSLGYLLMGGYPRARNSISYPKIAKWILYSDTQISIETLLHRDACRTKKFGKYFHFLEATELSPDWLSWRYGGFMAAFYQYWRARKEQVAAIIFLGTFRRSPIVNQCITQDIAKIIARDILDASTRLFFFFDFERFCREKFSLEYVFDHVMTQRGVDGLVSLFVEMGVDFGNPQVLLLTALSRGNRELFKLALARGAIINELGRNDTPLTYAVNGKNDAEFMRWLLSKGARVTQKAIMYAEKYYGENSEIFQLLTKTEALQKQNKHAAKILMGVSIGKFKRGIFARAPLTQLPPDVMQHIARRVARNNIHS